MYNACLQLSFKLRVYFNWCTNVSSLLIYVPFACCVILPPNLWSARVSPVKYSSSGLPCDLSLCLVVSPCSGGGLWWCVAAPAALLLLFPGWALALPWFNHESFPGYRASLYSSTTSFDTMLSCHLHHILYSTAVYNYVGYRPVHLHLENHPNLLKQLQVYPHM